MRRTVRAAVAVAVVAAMLPCASAVASASGSSGFTLGFGGTGFDGSVVVQSLPDASVLAVTKHGFGPGGSTSIRRVGPDGTTRWVTDIPTADGNGFYGAEFQSAAMLNPTTVLFAGYGDPAGSPNGKLDITVLAVSIDGQVRTVDTWGGAGSDFAREIGVCADGSFYIGGGSWDASPSPDETAAVGMADIFVTRFGADMQRQWTRVIGSANNDQLFALRCRDDGAVDLNAWAAGSVNGQGSNDYYNFFTARMDATGNTVRTIVTELDPGEWSPQGGVYAPDGSYYVIGESNSYYPGLPCTERALGGSFVSHYSADGNLLWRSILACGNLNRRIAVGASGDLFVIGSASSRRIADQQKFGGDDMLIHRYSPDGTRMSTVQFGSELDDVPSSLSIDGTGHLYVGGYTKGTYDGYTSVDDWDALVMRFDVGDVVPPASTTPVAPACTAASSTLLPESDTARAIWFYGDDLGESAMAALWDYASTHSPRDFGRVIAAGQDWFGSCRYPGVGLGTGSGYSWHDRNVVLWVWADEVDLATARQTVLDMVAALPATTTTTVPTTTSPPRTTVPAGSGSVACDQNEAAQLPLSASGHPVSFYGDDLGESAMAALWDYASTHGPQDFARVIAAGQDWFGTCSYPGVGLGTGSGYSWHDRNVVLWVWSDDVDLAVARQSVLTLVSGLVPVDQPVQSAGLIAAANQRPVAPGTVVTGAAAPRPAVSGAASPGTAAPVASPSAPTAVAPGSTVTKTVAKAVRSTKKTARTPRKVVRPKKRATAARTSRVAQW